MSKNSSYRYGIACCRVSSVMEILLVKRRFTYNFAAFVFGQYNECDNRRIMKLLNGMTPQEKLDILSLDYDTLWYKIWLYIPKKYTFNITDIHNITNSWKNENKLDKQDSKLDFYTKRKLKYKRLIRHGNLKIKSLIDASTNKQLEWEIPKGRKEHYESSIGCAIREFKEETCVPIDCCTLIDKHVIDVNKSMNVYYVNKYYIAIADYDIPLCVNMSKQQASEISDIKWMNIDNLNHIDIRHNLIDVCSDISNITEDYIKNSPNVL